MSHIDKLLARPNAKRSTPQREIVEEVLLKYNFQIEEGGVHVDVPNDLPTLNVDPEKMRAAVGALVSNPRPDNARPHPAPTAGIARSPEGCEIRTWLRDYGRGVDPRDHDH